MKKALLLSIILYPLVSFSQLSVKSVSSAHGPISFYQFLPPGYSKDSIEKFPLIIYLHGVGERGNGTTDLPLVLNQSLPKMIAEGATMTFTVRGKKYGFPVLMPQMSKVYINWQNFYVEDMIRYAKANLNIDTNRIFLTGWSLGGGGTWKFPTASVDSANLIAGIVPVAPAPDYTNLCNIARGRVAVWAHHARDDSSIPIRYTRDAVTGINACSPEIPARMSYYGRGKHTLVSIIAYDTLNTYQYPNMFQWMLGISRLNRKSTDIPPVASAGRDTVIALPSLVTDLDGSASYDPNDVIVAYHWQMISGPVSPNLKIKRKDYPTTMVTGLEPGKYVFRLTVSDVFNVSTSAEVSVTVALPADGSNANPYVYAGEDQVITWKRTTLIGTVRDFDGKILTYRWRQLSGPAKLNIIQREARAEIFGFKDTGSYSFELLATDNANPAGISRDTVIVFRKAAFPLFAVYWIKGKAGLVSYWQTLVVCLVIFAMVVVFLLYLIYIKKYHFKGNALALYKN
ncbi:MAG: hypothetical protein ABI151_07420 [Chitinophagaceae bacterium]